MGPIISLDKSSFQALSLDELQTMRSHFMQTLPPILVHEIVGDLAVEVRAAGSADRQVAILAAKFGGSGPATMWDYRTLCMESLRGNDPPMDGRIPARTLRMVPDPGGGYGGFIDLAPENEAILRWAEGDFRDDERDAAVAWQAEGKDLSIEPLQRRLDERRVVFPRCTTVAEAVETAEGLLRTPRLQGVFVEWLLEALDAPEAIRATVRTRFRLYPMLLFQFAPYAHYCAKALLAFVIARHFRVTTERPTDLRDMQYLFYAPFCMIFCSQDRFHRSLAPHLLREDQMFLDGAPLKADLRRLHDAWEELDEPATQRRAFALGSYPVPARDSVVCEAWGRFCRPWHPGAGNRAFNLGAEEERLAFQEARELFAAAGLGLDYQPIATG